MATSPTGTAKWKRIRAQAIRRAQQAGLTHCPMPGCGVPLDYRNSRYPNSAEVDHVIPRARGGPDHIENTQVMCRTCNRRKGGKTGTPSDFETGTPHEASPRKVFEHSKQW